MQLTLMFREYCHLCHQMRDALKAFQAQYQFDVQIVDVDSDPDLEKRYNELVPVLLHGEQEICHWHLDVEKLITFLEQEKGRN